MADPRTAPVTGHEEAAHKGGFPPFNKDTFDPQLIWLAITFIALYTMLSRIILPRIGGVIEARSARIARDLEQAEKLKGETDAALQRYEAALSAARANAGGIAKATRDTLTAETDRERAASEGMLNAKLAEAEARIQTTKQKSLGSVNEVAATVAGDVVAKLIGHTASADEITRALQPAAGE